MFSLEEDILQGVLGDCDACPSARQLAESFEVNPSTAAKALEVLYRRGVLFRRPGAIHGVSIGAQQRIRARRIADFGTPSMNRNGEHSSPRSGTVSGNFTRFHRDLAYTPGVRSRRLIDLTRQDNPVEYENAIFGSMQNLMNIREASLPLRLQELCEPDGVSD
ncbi:GntR family transcriptional regulator [Auritidibacter ignavus]|uniref:GntR family transcriptional regulator n=1 Tax=Auritidibacter ignavus TaxID=678932 RepID=A0AAJ6AGH3_9MICC|nr:MULTISPECIES: GntR family transcriptional regulator [Auritidibacter]WGH80779.1 GntR family transcriptional regulator [Auritidibacter ignavus]WGH83026.1 GntR family transcriptional regulator [Auritidibacter ignavus]WGH85896.1 GntR family transcriptional regulator [Auritidibacter ignavus]WGH88183.1 GntR family transcriptional regulator [Auritidibacter ignavus]WGH92302.1 GntR family transcriptional regulator [Auritidibacter ignavus]